MFRKNNLSTVLTATVYRGGEDITSQISEFKWTKSDENGKVWFGNIGSKGKKKSGVKKNELAENNSYDDKGVGYDIKVIGHGEIDSQNGQIGDSNSKTSGNVISVTNESYKTKNGMNDFEVLNNLMSVKGKDLAKITRNNFAKVIPLKKEITRQ